MLDTSYYEGGDAPRSLCLPQFPIAAAAHQNHEVVRNGKRDWVVLLDADTFCYVQPSSQFQSTLLDLPDIDLYLIGFFQSDKYFRANAAQIRAELTFDNVVHNERSQALAQRIAGSLSVSLHVRRTDYLNAPRYSVLSADYYQQAATLLRRELPQPTFFIFSDDLAYCREVFHWPDAVIVDCGELRANPVVELSLMAACRHHIIPNSTFSWWGAWLNPRRDKRVLAPSAWVHPSELMPIDDVLPSDWQRLG